MKNKYQEALNFLVNKKTDFEDAHETLLSGKTLQELVDKETPMKPRNISLLTNPPQHRTWCNNCYVVHLERTFKFCPNCGQKVDWNVD